MFFAAFGCGAFATPGALDTSFNGTGFVDVANVLAQSVAVQPNGMIVWGGQGAGGVFAVGRNNADGSPDTSFGTGGSTFTAIGPSSWARAVALQGDGKIVAGGTALVRYNADGSLDQGFGTAGVAASIPVSMSALTMQPDGKIVAAGSATGVGIQPALAAFGISRFNADGSVDATFGSGGVTITRIGDTFDGIHSIALQPDGKILAAGDTDRPGHQAFALARYLPNGSLDPGFGTGGIVSTPFGAIEDRLLSVALQPDGKIVVGGGTTDTSLQGRFVLIRYQPDGTLDPTFGSGGIVTTSVGGIWGEVASVLIQPDGKIVAAGTNALYLKSIFCDLCPPSHYHFALVRYLPNGQVDTTFGLGGQVSVGTGADDNSSALSATFQPDGKIVMAGYSFTRSGPITGTGTLARFTNQDSTSAYVAIPALAPWGAWLLSALVAGAVFWVGVRRRA